MIRGSVIAVLLLLGACQPDAPLAISDPRMKTPLPGLDKSVGYFELVNNEARDRTIASAAIDGVRAVEIHRTFEQDGMMRMRRMDSVLVPANGRVVFESGGLHLMLFGIDPDTAARRLTLTFADGTEAVAEIREISPTGE